MTKDEAAELAVAELIHACPGVRPQDVRRVDYHPLTAGPAATLDNLTTGRRLSIAYEPMFGTFTVWTGSNSWSGVTPGRLREAVSYHRGTWADLYPATA